MKKYAQYKLCVVGKIATIFEINKNFSSLQKSYIDQCNNFKLQIGIKNLFSTNLDKKL